MKKLLLLYILLISQLAYGQWFTGTTTTGSGASTFYPFLEIDVNNTSSAQLQIEAGPNVPTGVSTYGPVGSMYLSKTGSAFLKQDDGTTTNWKRLAFFDEISGGGGGSSTAFNIVDPGVILAGEDSPTACSGVNALVDCFRFSPTSTNEITFQAKVPSSYNPGDDVRIIFQGSSDNIGDVDLFLESYLIQNSEDMYASLFSNLSTSLLTYSLPTSTGFSFTTTGLLVASSGVINGQGLAVDDLLVFKLIRKGTVDTSTGYLNNHSIRIDFQP